ncbi:MAG: primosomal protein N' [Alphaproteobacteria bacterium]|nr:primosomal protein N' [Alphaproteobacteria bacterium]
MSAPRAKVLLPIPMGELYDYRLPDGTPVRDGALVRVPFGGRTLHGVLWGEGASDVPEAKLKGIDQLGALPPFTPAMRSFIDWVADYTLTPRGAVLKMALSVPEALEAPKAQRAFRIRRVQAPHPGPLPKGEGVSRTPARTRVLELLADGIARSAAEITKQARVGAAVVKGLAEAGAIEEVSLAVPLPEQHFDFERRVTEFSPAQTAAADALIQKVAAKTYSATLLDGVTGSGKTEVYFAAIEAALKAGQQVLVLLPEIALSVQWLERFRARFGAAPAVWHSGVPRAKKRDTWRGVAEGSTRLVVGARSALFLPFKNLALIVVDEEHEAAYKQEEGVIYQARVMAVVRAYIESIPVVLVSATPALETVANVENKRYGRLHLPERHAGAEYPEVEIADIRGLPATRWISDPLRAAIADTLGKGQQVMLFLNRRGYAPLTLCRACGHRFQCPSCSTWLVQHGKGVVRVESRESRGRFPPPNLPPQAGGVGVGAARDSRLSTLDSRHSLQCHHCGYVEPMPKACPKCAVEDKLAPCGPGVERVRDEVAALFPDAKLALMDSDSVQTVAEAEALVARMERGDIDILVGTQMMAKGHHFPKLALVGVIDADIGLSGGDLRASERTYQLLHQITGRAGREDAPGRAILQTAQPDHPAIRAMAEGDRDGFLGEELHAREIALMPPFTRLAAIIVSGIKEDEARRVAHAIGRQAMGEALPQVTILGPAPAPLYRLRGKFRFRLLVRADRTLSIQKLLRRWIAAVPIPRTTQVKVDVDPYSFL